MRRILLLLVVSGLLTACDDSPKHLPEPAAASAAMPADTALAQGADTLLDHSINGYNGMPPMGLCMGKPARHKSPLTI